MRPQNLSKDQFKAILSRYAKGLSSPQEKLFVERWYENLGQEFSLELSEVDQGLMEDKFWQEISDKIRAKAILKPTPPPTRAYWKVAGIAATFLLAVLSVLYFNHTSPVTIARPQKQINSGIKVISNETASVKEINLEDGSVVALQPQSKLKVKRFGVSNKREVYLDGEAFFEVAHDAKNPFFVYTGNITVRVLGTSFRVNASRTSKAVEVAVNTGRVSVTKVRKKSSSPLHTLTEEIILTPNQKAIYNEGGDEVLTALIDNPKRVTHEGDQHVMEFDEEPVANILAAISKAYEVDILFDEETIRSCKLTTSLTDEGLYDRLNILCKAIRGTYERKGTQIIIHSKGCEYN